MTTKTTALTTTAKAPAPPTDHETYIAPKPPADGRIIGLDCHPDTFTAAVFRGTTPHDAVKTETRSDMSLDDFLGWAAREFTRKDLFLMEAGSNSFEIHRRLLALGLRAAVMESCHVGKHAKTYADNDRMAAARIALVYLQGNAPCVWVPDAVSRERRELLHAYQKAVAARTAATNSLKGYLNQFAIRAGKRDLNKDATREWVLRQRDWSPLQREMLADHFTNLGHCAARRQTLCRLVASQVAGEPLMLRTMKLLGIGLVSAFALLAVIGDIRRFDTPAKLAAYIGLNPGQRESGRGKRVALGIGKRGRGDLRHLLIEGAQSVMRYGRGTPLGKWGNKLFARKGNRNVAVAAVARKQVTHVWHLLMGNPPAEVESDKSLTVKLGKLAHALGRDARRNLALPSAVGRCVDHFRSLICGHPPRAAAA